MAFVPGDQRASTFASIYVVSYAAFSAPAVVAGVLVQPLGLDRVLLGYTVVVMVAAAIGVVNSTLELRHERDMIERAPRGERVTVRVVGSR